jgi:hypothetical protein
LKERIRFEREIQDLELLPGLPKNFVKLLKLKRQIVLVAGFNYENPNHKLDKYCINRIEHILNKRTGARKDASLTFTLFDVGAGVVKSFEVVGGKREWVEKAKFTPVTSANYTGKVFNKDPAGVMSVTDVYDFVRAQGKSMPGSVQELSFFSHGWVGGPILVNSFDSKPDGSPERDPDDKDARRRKDFSAPNMDATAQAEFRDAFSVDGFTWVWGCVFIAPPFQVIHRMLKNKKYNPSKVKDADTFKFDFSSAQATKFFYVDPIFFPARNADGTFPLSFEKSFAEIKEFLQRRIEATYCKSIAKATRRKCFGALPGTYADYEKNKTRPLMVVPRSSPPYDDNFLRYIKFYTSHLGINLDPENRGYGTYLP